MGWAAATVLAVVLAVALVLLAIIDGGDADLRRRYVARGRKIVELEQDMAGMAYDNERLRRERDAARAQLGWHGGAAR